jgi:predicted RNase H-like HicB family nuclease
MSDNELASSPEFDRGGRTASERFAGGDTADYPNLAAFMRNTILQQQNIHLLTSEPAPPSTERNELTVEFEREDDGRWLAEVPQLAGVMAYGNSPQEAGAAAAALARRVLADRLEHGEAPGGSVVRSPAKV